MWLIIEESHFFQRFSKFRPMSIPMSIIKQGMESVVVVRECKRVVENRIKAPSVVGSSEVSPIVIMFSRRIKSRPRIRAAEDATMIDWAVEEH